MTTETTVFSESVLALALVLGACGCGVRSNLPPGTAIELATDEAALVLGVRPSFHVQIVEGRSVSDTAWEIDEPDVPKGNLAPEQEYIVIKLPPTQNNAEYGVSLVWDEQRDSAPLISACPGSTTISFGLPPGQVTYVGDLLLQQTARGLSASLSLDAARARVHLSRVYPQLAARLRVLPAREKTVANPERGRTDGCLLPTQQVGHD